MRIFPPKKFPYESFSDNQLKMLIWVNIISPLQCWDMWPNRLTWEQKIIRYRCEPKSYAKITLTISLSVCITFFVQKVFNLILSTFMKFYSLSTVSFFVSRKWFILLVFAGFYLKQFSIWSVNIYQHSAENKNWIGFSWQIPFYYQTIYRSTRNALLYNWLSSLNHKSSLSR